LAFKYTNVDEERDTQLIFERLHAELAGSINQRA
jgi:hypothetical protein